MVPETYVAHIVRINLAAERNNSKADLPALGKEGGAGGAATAATLVGALRAITTGRLDEEGAPRAQEVKTIMDADKETYVTLLRYGNVTRSNDVAPLL